MPLGPSGRYLRRSASATRVWRSHPQIYPGGSRNVGGRAPTTGPAIEELLAGNEELAAFQRAREAVVLDLVRELAEAVSARVHVVHWGEPRRPGSTSPRGPAADRIVVLGYADG